METVSEMLHTSSTCAPLFAQADIIAFICHESFKSCMLLLLLFREAKKQALLFAAVFSFSQAVIYAMYAGAFRFGAYLIEIGDMEAIDVYRQVHLNVEGIIFL
jgi:hypothetical protein